MLGNINILDTFEDAERFKELVEGVEEIVQEKEDQGPIDQEKHVPDEVAKENGNIDQEEHEPTPTYIVPNNILQAIKESEEEIIDLK